MFQDNISTIRSQFPILNNAGESKPLVYLDNAATSQKPEAIINTIAEYYKTANANIHRGIYDLSSKSTTLWEKSHAIVADFINAKSEEVFFVRSTTEGINYVADMIPLAKDDVIVTTEMEHHSNILPWQKVAKRTGAKLEWIPVLSDFRLDLNYLEFLVRKYKSKLKAVSITHVSNTLGVMNDIKELAEILQGNGTLLVVDGAQAVAHMPVDVKKLGCDFYIFSGHKMFAANGAGVVYGRKELLQKLEPAEQGGGMISDVTKNGATWAVLPEKFEAGTPDVAGGISLAAAILWLYDMLSGKLASVPHDYLARIDDYTDNKKLVDMSVIKEGWQAYKEYEKSLVDHLITKLRETPKVKIFGPKNSDERTSLVAFEIEGIHPHDVAGMLNDENIAVRAGMHCTHPLHRKFGIPATARVSFSVFNTKDEIDLMVSTLDKLIETLG